jgi:molybdate transport system substrate-binding protein
VPNVLFPREAARRLGISLALLLLGLFALPGSYAQQAQTVKIAAASDLEPVLPALIAQFQTQTGINAEAAYASSATLAQQIINGGPFDLFLAADLSFPEKVVAAGLSDTAKPIPYARGTLVLWSRGDFPLHHATGGLTVDDLRNPALHKVAIANPETAPYGRAAMAALDSMGLADQIKAKLVVAENIAQAAQFADSGNADAGLISLTSALTPRLKADGSYVEIPAGSYPPILQGAVVVKNSGRRDDAHRFLDFLTSPPIQKELAERGLKAP